MEKLSGNNKCSNDEIVLMSRSCESSQLLYFCTSEKSKIRCTFLDSTLVHKNNSIIIQNLFQSFKASFTKEHFDQISSGGNLVIAHQIDSHNLIDLIYKIYLVDKT